MHIGTDWLKDILRLVERLGGEGATPRRLWHLGCLVDSLVEHDRTFLGEAGRQLWLIIEDARKKEQGSDDEPPPEPWESIEAPDGALPLALVTPRMIRDAPWVHWVAPILREP